MALPIEATPELDIDSWVHLCERMEYLAAHPHPARVPVIDEEFLKKTSIAIKARQERMEAERKAKQALANKNVTNSNTEDKTHA